MKKSNWLVFALLLVLVSALSLTVFADGTLTTGTATEPLNVKKGTVTSNVSAFGHSFSGMQPEEALEFVSEKYNALLSAELRAKSADEDAEWSSTLAELGVTFDEDSVRKGIQESVLTGNLLKRYKLAKDRENEPYSFGLGAKYNEEYILETVGTVVQEWNRDPVESTVKVVNGELNVVVGQNGHEYKYEDGVKEFIDALKDETITDEGLDLSLEYTTVEALLSPERVAGFSILGSCTTAYDRPSTQILANRENNLVVSTNNMSGRMFAPDEIVSALDLYGSVTSAGGYLPAGTYVGGNVMDQVGGGICQTTSTMYNAVLMAELEVVFRKSHSSVVLYLDPSQDAMVYAAGGSDFKFKNTTSDYIIIDASVDKAKHEISVYIIGHEDRPATHTVRYESEILEYVIPPLNNVVNDTDLVVGWSDKKFIDPPDLHALPAVKSRLWKITTDNGVETRSVVGNRTDSYKAMNGTLYVAPDVQGDLYRNGVVALGIKTYFINDAHTSVAANPTLWEPEQRAAFNTEMKAKMAEKGYTWQGDGDEYIRYCYYEGKWQWLTIMHNSLVPVTPDPTDAPDPTEPGGTDAPSEAPSTDPAGDNSGNQD